MDSADARQTSRVEQLRQQLLHNHPRRRKIVGDYSGRKVNIWRADEQQLLFAIDRDVQLAKVETCAVPAQNARVAGRCKDESTEDAAVSDAESVKALSAGVRAGVDDAFKESFKQFRQAAVSDITRGIDQGGLGAFDAQAAVQSLAAGGTPPLPDNVVHRQSHPGFFVLRGVFTEPLAKAWMHHVAREYTSWPGNRSNMSHCYVPAGGVVSAKEVSAGAPQSSDGGGGNGGGGGGNGGGGGGGVKFGSRLAWLTLGYHFNWTARTYDRQERGSFPSDLRRLCRGIVTAVSQAVQPPPLPPPQRSETQEKEEAPCFPDARFTPSAAIVNFYDAAKHCSMGGHLDDREEDLSQPVVSLSFGLPAVFLMGGRSRDTTPLAAVLHHGDIVIMSGEARVGYHGVPRIINNIKEEKGVRRGEHADQDNDGDGGDDTNAEEAHQRGGAADEAARLEDVLSGRVNVNVRQVYSDDSALLD